MSERQTVFKDNVLALFSTHRVCHHFLKLDLKDHTIFQGFDELIRTKIKCSGCLIELSILLPCITLVIESDGKSRQMFLNDIFDFLQCQAFFS